MKGERERNKERRRIKINGEAAFIKKELEKISKKTKTQIQEKDTVPKKRGVTEKPQE